jgi:hypothetical protein
VAQRTSHVSFVIYPYCYAISAKERGLLGVSQNSLLNAFAKHIIMKKDYVLKKACLKNT